MTRRATIRTEHRRPGLVAAALVPDNTDEMSTRVERVDDGDGNDADDGDGNDADDGDGNDADDSDGNDGDGADDGDGNDADGADDGDSRGADDGTDDCADGAVVTTIERDVTGGLRTTADDYVTNLQVAQRVIDATNTDTDTSTRQ